MNKQAITGQQLLLYYYDDGLEPAERDAVAAALQADAGLSERYRELAGSLDGLQDGAVTPAPPYLRQQWHDLVSREARLERQKQPQPQAAGEPSRPWLGWVLGLATTLALGIVIGRWLQPENLQPAVGEPGVAVTAPSLPNDATGGTAFTRAVQFYLDGQQSELAGMQDPSSETNQLLLLQIIAQNRLIEKAAMANHSPDLARLIRAFEPVLLKLADPATSPEQAAALQRQLAFELQGVLTKLQQAPSNPATVI